ncbi:hypothetical protein ACFQZC_00700 [Streptacidiphilus monticola]
MDAATTDHSTLTANPDGSFTLTQTLMPVRKWTGSGWEKLDPTLKRNPDGSITTTATTSGLTLSPAAPRRWPRWSTAAAPWPSPSLTLPAPVLSGPTATYGNVLPGVDLVATATAQGAFSEVLVVKNATAAANPRLKTLTLAAATKGVKLSADTAGNITANDAHGPVFTAPAPVMWDSTTTPTGTTAPAVRATAVPGTGQTVDPATGEPATSSTRGPGEHARTATLHAKATARSITLTPDASLLTGHATKYPVYIDPFVTPSAPSSLQEWTYTNSYYDTQNFWRTTDDLRVGYTDDPTYPPTYTARSYLQINVPSGLHGAKILSSQLNITEDWSWSCTPRPSSCGLPRPGSPRTPPGPTSPPRR